jgi:hypothetical protein
VILETSTMRRPRPKLGCWATEQKILKGREGDLKTYFKYVRYEGLMHVARMGGGIGVHRVLVGKPEGKRPLGRPRRRWEDNIKKDLQEVGGDCGNWRERA